MSILDCFAMESIPPDAQAGIYDSTPMRRFWYIREQYNHVGLNQTVPNKPVLQVVSEKKDTRRITVPMVIADDFTLNQYEDAAAAMLLEVARWFPTTEDVAFDASQQFKRRNLTLSRVLTEQDHRFIQPGIALAVADPMYLGRRFHQGHRMGLAVFNRMALLAYRIRRHEEHRYLVRTHTHPYQASTWQGFGVPKGP